MAKKELHTGDMTIQQKDSIVMPGLDEAFERDAEIVAVDEKALHKDYVDALAFAEEPIMIRIEPSNEKFAPKVVDCWVQGRGAEVFDVQQKRWYFLGALPVGHPIVTRRKYVEVLARSKQDSVRTEVIGPESERPENVVHRHTSQRATFSVIHDRNPKGAEWLSRLLYYNT